MPLPPSFTDSNLLVYALDAADPIRQSKTQRLYANLVTDDALLLSAQVLNELYRNLTNPKSKVNRPAISHADAVRIVQRLLTDARQTVSLTPDVCLRGYELTDRHTMALWDAMILSAAIEAGATVLYTEDVPGSADSTTGELEGVRYVNPFV